MCFDKAGTGICGLYVGDERTDLRPRAIRSYDQVGDAGRTVRENDFVSPVAHGPNRRNLVIPLDRFIRKRLDQQSAKIAAVYLGAFGGVATWCIEEHIAIQIDDAFRIFAGTNEWKEGVEQACIFEGDLSVVFVHVEKAALRSRMNGCFCFVDGGGNAVKVKDTGKDKAAGACTDNCDWVSHVALL
jgi:hypothetical protein